MNTNENDLTLKEVLTLESDSMQIVNTEQFCKEEYKDLPLPFFELLRAKNNSFRSKLFTKNMIWQFNNLSNFAWAFGSLLEVDFKEVVAARRKKRLFKFLDLFFDEEYEYIFEKRDVFKDVIKLYLLTIVPKIIVDKNIVFDYEKIKKIILINSICYEKEKIRIDKVIEELSEDTFKKAIEYTKEKNYEKLTELIKKTFEAEITEESLTATDIFLILNAYSYKEA